MQEDPGGEVDPRERLNPRQHRAMLRVARGYGLEDIAEECRVSLRRVHRWLKTPMFMRAVARERADLQRFEDTVMEAVERAFAEPRVTGEDPVATGGQDVQGRE
jgi:hypothetical protein